jgi:phosphoribosylformimino-5-aminoimidazole carboxamide ribotide isomerase
MIIFPAIDIKNGQCVRLFKGDFSTAHKVAENPLETSLNFKKTGAEWIHMVDLDGAKKGVRVNSAIFLEIAKNSGLKVQLGGGIRDMDSLEYYLSRGISRCILGSAAIKNPEFVRNAVKEFGDKIAVGIDAVNGMVATEGWLEVSEISFIEIAKQMEQIGVQTLIFTDISKDGTLEGPNFKQLSELSNAVSCDIIASGGIRDLSHINKITELNIYGAICGKSLYSGTLNLSSAIIAAEPERLFRKSKLVPAVIQDDKTEEVLMLAYMDIEAYKRTLKSGTTWFWSRSRCEYWNKGATSGNYQKVVSISSDCDDDTLLIRVIQKGNACHTGSYSCFFKEIKSYDFN